MLMVNIYSNIYQHLPHRSPSLVGQGIMYGARGQVYRLSESLLEFGRKYVPTGHNKFPSRS
jgi:hypothetical protein